MFTEQQHHQQCSFFAMVLPTQFADINKNMSVTRLSYDHVIEMLKLNPNVTLYDDNEV
jgi:hypothetical protein